MTPLSEAIADDQEHQYNLALSVSSMPALTNIWPARAAAMRRRHPPLADIVYGPHPREKLDLFRAARPRGTLVFIHGGFWRARSKDEFSWLAEGFLEAGYSVALPSYPLCPQVAFSDIAPSVRAAFVHLYWEILNEAERRHIVVTGHSAGGYLVADLLGTDWAAHGLPATPFQGALPISGVFDLAPLLATSINDDLRLDAQEAARLSLHHAEAQVPAAIVVAMGGAETEGFRQQSRHMLEPWAGRRPTFLTIAGANHFDILDNLATPGAPLHDAALALLEGRAATGKHAPA